MQNISLWQQLWSFFSPVYQFSLHTADEEAAATIVDSTGGVSHKACNFYLICLTFKQK